MELATISLSIQDHWKEFLSHPNVFDFYGLERGGHHAVAKWLLESGPWPYCFVQMAHTKQPVPSWGTPNGWHTSVRKPIAGGLTYGPDAPLDSPSHLTDRKVILCVRDIRNLLASRRRWNQTHHPLFNVNIPAVELWQTYARQALGDVDYFDGRCVSIVFDAWATKPAYRDHKIAQLNTTFGWGLKSNEASIARVAQAGGGSSFDGLDYDAQAHRMDVTQRWKYIQNDSHVQSLLTPEALELNKRLLHAATL